MLDDIQLTKHFSERWQERIGNWPTPEAVAHYIRQSVQLQKPQALTLEGGEPYRVLAIYWNKELNLAILVDERGASCRAVTVLTDRGKKRRGK